MSDTVQNTAIERFRQSRRMARYLSHAVLLEEGGISIFGRSAMVMLSVGFVALVAWAATTQIKETATTFGQVIPTGAVNKIQHLEGGIISEIMVRDGDLVDKNQVLMRLKPEASQAELSQVETRLASLRLEAERYRALAESRDPDFSALMDRYPELAQNQQEIYRIKTDLDISQRAILLVQIKERNAELAQLQQQARARETIAEANLRLNELHNSQREEAFSELGRLGGEIAQTSETLRKLKDRVARLEIHAPSRGYIKGLQFTTIGGVIAPAQVVMELVPTDDVLVAETRISTEDIGHVHLGQPVTVKVSAFDYIRYGSISGELVSISASTFVDEDGRPYYKGRVALDSDLVGDGARAQPIIPGMTVQADIQTGERTLLQYLLKPVYVSLDQAFSER